MPLGRFLLYMHAILGLVLVLGTFRYLLASGVGAEKLARAVSAALIHTTWTMWWSALCFIKAYRDKSLLLL